MERTDIKEIKKKLGLDKLSTIHQSKKSYKDIDDNTKYIVYGYQYAMYGSTIKKKGISPACIWMTEEEQRIELQKKLLDESRKPQEDLKCLQFPW